MAVHPNVYIDSLLWGGWHWGNPAAGKVNINYMFAAAGVDLTQRPVFAALDMNGTSDTWLDYGMQAYRDALQSWANVANLQFTEVFDYTQTNLLALPAEPHEMGDPNTRGVHETPEFAAEVDGKAWGVFNFVGLTPAELAPGSGSLRTLVHELGHALGLAHAHDDGGGSSVFPGVTAAFDDLGDNELNQGIFTIMCYNRGWPAGGRPGDATDTFGLETGPMAFDIAAIQYLYGSNNNFQSGNNTYVLGHVPGFPDIFDCIWDTGGTDKIIYSGTFGCTIDLRAATLKNEEGGGGFVSYVDGAPSSNLDFWNGYTIANRVVIENATGGSGADVLIGNGAANVLVGNGGNDAMLGGAGKDILNGGPGNDTYYIDSADVLTDASGTDTLRLSFSRTLTNGFENLVLLGSSKLNGTGNSAANSITGNGAANVLKGSSGNDTLGGGAGSDKLTGGKGRDIMTGGSGADDFDFDAVSETGKTSSTRDRIQDFLRKSDDIDVSTIDASTVRSGNNKFVWKGTASFTNSTAGELRYKKFNDDGSSNDYTIVYGDTDGDKSAEFHIQLKGLITLGSGDFIL